MNNPITHLINIYRFLAQKCCTNIEQSLKKYLFNVNNITSYSNIFLWNAKHILKLIN